MLGVSEVSVESDVAEDRASSIAKVAGNVNEGMGVRDKGKVRVK